MDIIGQIGQLFQLCLELHVVVQIAGHISSDDMKTHKKITFAFFGLVSFIFLSGLALADAPVSSTNSTLVNFPIVYLPARDYGFQVNWTDAIDVDGYDVALIEENFTGVLRNDTTSRLGNVSYFNISDLSAGKYQFRFLANDSLDVWGTTETWNITITKATPTGVNSINPGWTTNYGTSTTVTCTLTAGDVSTILNLDKDGPAVNSAVSPITYTVIDSAGTHDYTCEYPESENYTVSSNLDTDTQTINKVTPTLTINRNVTTPIVYGNSSDFQGSGCPSQLTCTLFRGNSSWSGTGNDTALLGVGVYAYNYSTAGNTNYTSATATNYTLEVTIATRSCTLTTNSTWTRTFNNIGSSTSCSVSAGSSDGSMTFTRNTTGKTSPDVVTNYGIYAYSCQWGVGTNYSACTVQTNNLIINKANPALTASVSSPIDQLTSSDYSGSESNAGDTLCDYILERNGVQIATGSSVSDTATHPVGTYNYTYYTIGCANYNGAVNALTLIVIQTGSNPGGGTTSGVTTPIIQSILPSGSETTGNGNIFSNFWHNIVDFFKGLNPVQWFKNIFGRI
jgi:hypothetical protein